MTSWKYCFASLTFAAFAADSVAYSQAAQSSTSGRAATSSTTASKVPASLEIFGVGGLPANFRARGNSTFDVTVNVSVRNSGEQGASYILAASIPSSPEPARSKPLQIAAKSTSRTPFRIQTTIGNAAFQGGEMPIVVRLLGTDGREVDQFRLMVPFSAATPAPRAGTVPAARTTTDPNLALDGVELIYRGITSTGGRGQRYSIVVRVRNTQASATWGYPASVSYAVSIGTPETELRPALGASARGRADLRVGPLGPGEVRSTEWVADPVILETGLWTTLHVSISSTTDSDPADNALYLVFIPGQGEMTQQRMLRAPPSLPAQVTRP